MRVFDERDVKITGHDAERVAIAGNTLMDGTLSGSKLLSVETEVVYVQNDQRASRHDDLNTEDPTRDNGVGNDASAGEGAATDHDADTSCLLARARRHKNVEVAGEPACGTLDSHLFTPHFLQTNYMGVAYHGLQESELASASSAVVRRQGLAVPSEDRDPSPKHSLGIGALVRCSKSLLRPGRRGSIAA